MDTPIESYLEDRLILRLIQSFARRITRTIKDSSFEETDVQQELLCNLRRRSSRYDPAKSSFRTFAAMVLRHHADSIVKHHRAAKRRPLGGMVYLDQDVDDGEDDATLHELIGPTELDPAWPASESRLDHRDLALDLRRTLRLLPAQLRETANALKGAGATEAANYLKIHRSVLYDRRAELRRYFERAGLREYLQE